MISKFKKNYKFILGVIVGIIISIVGVYATTIESKNVSYDNSKSGISATTMQQALDELYSKVPKKNQNFKMAYTYTDACITGEESSCQKTECYKTKTANSCKAGDIIDYQVNNEETIRFHVMYDKGDTLVMQSQKDTVTGITYGNNGSDSGPTIAIEALESVTSNWSNVEDQPYQMGVTPFVGGNFYTGCDMSSNSCTKISYTWDSRTAKARMITVQEAVDLGCSYSMAGPKWMHHYSKVGSNSSVNISPGGYFTMNLDSAHSFGSNIYFFITIGGITTSYSGMPSDSARAVIIVSK